MVLDDILSNSNQNPGQIAAVNNNVLEQSRFAQSRGHGSSQQRSFSQSHMVLNPLKSTAN